VYALILLNVHRQHEAEVEAQSAAGGRPMTV
jgi:hypothetical protein